jgi:hypothetical protein
MVVEMALKLACKMGYLKAAKMVAYLDKKRVA